MNKKLKYAIFNTLRFVPDGIMLRAQYFVKLHRWLDLNKPQRFTEWIQWYKAYYRNAEMPQCTDKYLVRDFVKKQIGNDKYLNKLYQVCDNAKEIDFNSLPQKFVIKTTDGGNGDNIFICQDKHSINIKDVIQKINGWRHKRYENISREWAYTGATNSRIIVEEYLEDSNNKDGSIDDYKFLCFNGKFQYLWVDKNRYSDHRRGFWDRNLNFLSDVKSDHKTFDTPPVLPPNIKEMISLSEKLSAAFPFARIDWYNLNGVIVFGEITFYPWSGYVQYTPDTFDFELGNCFASAVKELNIKL